MEEYDQHLRLVLQTLQEQKVYVKFSKCEFWLDSLALLGHVVSGEGIKVDPRKIEAVQSWPRPTTTTKIKSFLGLAWHYRQFMEGFSSIVRRSNCTMSRDVNPRQRRWLELLKDYDVTILYNSRKANVVVDALSRKAGSMSSLAFISVEEMTLDLDLQSLANRLRDGAKGDANEVTISDDGVLRLQGHLCVPNVDGLRETILEEAHILRYSIHPGATKMYRDLSQHYWRCRMKKDIVEYLGDV
ncbi:uncharacterized protein [Nicotiana tomentosiformis]|uniref:uncharacterized protein n=1 Tax=Nicotiana tomentosiformis TaxID=4098 RepID=UPI00388C4994